MYELQTTFRLGGPIGDFIGFRGDLLRDILQIYIVQGSYICIYIYIHISIYIYRVWGRRKERVWAV